METKNKDLINTFYYALPNNGSTEGLNSTTRRYEEAKQCALIAEDFAISFVLWMSKNQFSLDTYDNKGDIKELLEIYKKEKGL